MSATSRPIYAYLVHAAADKSNDRFPAGRRHAMLVFIKQDDDEPNWALCESIVRNAGWTDFKAQSAMLATPESVRAMQKTEDPAVNEAYAHASKHGFRILVFSIPIPQTH
jgi:hypothetical protein